MNFLLYSSCNPSTRCSSRDGSQRDRDQRLRFATLEQSRTVNAGQQVGFAVDAAQAGVVTTVGTGAGDDQIANDLFFQIVPNRFESIDADRTFGVRIRNHFLLGAVAKFFDSVFPSLLAGCLHLGLEFVVVAAFQLAEQTVILWRDVFVSWSD